MFGLYVGNTSACIAMLKDDEVQVLVNDLGQRVTPASVEVLENERVVGVSAKAGPNSGNVIFHSKMYLSPERNIESKIEGYCSITEDDGEFQYVVDLGSKKLSVTPYEAVSEIFTHLYKIASSAARGNVEINAILTVPHYFSNDAKEEFCEAAISSGFNVLQVITDTGAAVMAYDCLEKVESIPRKILVCRVGGTSMEVNVCVVSCGMLKILKTYHESGIGGDALTSVIFDYLAQDVKMRMQFNPLENSRCRMKLYKLAEASKHILSTNGSTTCCLETFYNGMDYSHTVTRSRIESLISPVLSLMTKSIMDMLKDLNLKENEIDKVILCGGTLKVPKLRKFFHDSFPSAEILSSISPDEVIAFGAAKQGLCYVESLTIPYSVLHKDVSRLETAIYYRVKSSEKYDCILLKDTVLPVAMTKTIPVGPGMAGDTLDKVVEIHLFDNGVSVGLLKELVVIPKAGSDERINLELAVDVNGVLECRVAE